MCISKLILTTNTTDRRTHKHMFIRLFYLNILNPPNRMHTYMYVYKVKRYILRMFVFSSQYTETEMTLLTQRKV